MTFAQLKSDVQEWMGRTDIPSSVYTLANADVNRDVRTLNMESTTTLSASTEFTNLPSDYAQVVTAYVDDDSRDPLRNMTAHGANIRRGDTGEPWGYAIVKDQIKLIPTPDGTYSIYLRYIASMADLSADSDTNVVLTEYPDVYLYAALRHAAVWAQDMELASSYQVAYSNAVEGINRNERRKKTSGPVAKRAAYDLGRR